MAAKKDRKVTLKLSSRTHFLLLIIPFVFFLFLITRGISYPYVGYNAWNFNTYSLIAHNYNSFGYVESKLAPIISVSDTLPQNPALYLHHPQMISIILSLFFRFFGESFWVGRLAVILFSAGSFLLMILLARDVSGRMHALFVAFAASLIPANAVFGRMIGMEPLVLFFALLSVYLTNRFFKDPQRRVSILIHLSVILGVLSDWPMVYFSFFLMLFCVMKKNTRLGISIFLTACVTEMLFLFYVYLLMGGFSDLFSAIVQRSTGGLVTLSYWPLIWISTIAIRLVLYFNPVFIIASFIFLFLAVKKILSRNFSERYLISVLFFVFGLLNVLFFPEGSFGHAYWIYYFVPFIAFGTAEVAGILSKRHTLLLICLLIFSTLFVLKIVDWKTKEIAVNIWRYELGEKIRHVIPAYENILLNEQSAIDPDLFQYAFHQDYKIASPSVIHSFTNSYSFYVHSCIHECNTEEIRPVLQTFAHQRYEAAQGEAYVFFLNKQASESGFNSAKTHRQVETTTLPENTGIVKNLYQKTMEALHLPQL